jgi:hypothetical protein
VIPFSETGLYNPAGPTLDANEFMRSAMDQPLSPMATLFEAGKQGALDSFGLGTFIRRMGIDQGAPTAPTLNPTRPQSPQEFLAAREAAKPIDKPTYEKSPYFRPNIPWDASMTEDRAASLAAWDDAKKVREFYSQKRPIASFIGSLGGQALDPINYIPVGGEVMAAKAGLGTVGKAVVGSAIDAAGNTAIAALSTAPERARFGDDTSWRTTVSQIAMAGLIGAGFGSIGGGLRARSDARLIGEAVDRLATVKRTQESRIALNEAIDAVVNGEDVRLSPNGLAAVDNAVPDLNRVQSYIDGQSVNGPKPVGLLRFLASEGGVKDFGGEVASLDLTNKFVPGSGRLVREKGMDLDHARLVAAEAGYFPQYGSIDAAMEHSTVNDLLDAMSRESRGEPVYTLDGQDRADAMAAHGEMQASYDRAREAVDEHISDALPPEIKVRAAEIIFHEKLSPDDALERAIMEDYYSNGGADVPLLSESGPIEVPGFHDNPISGGNAGKRSASSGRGPNNVGGEARQSAANGVPSESARGQDRPPEGLKAATARVGKPEDIKALAEQHGIGADGSYPEEIELKQVDTEGRMTTADHAAMEEAQQTVELGDSYAEALKAAAGCLI